MADSLRRSVPGVRPWLAADLRVLFAAERTRLAWQRSAIALMGPGFMVERFGLFLQLVAHRSLTGSQRSFPLGLRVNAKSLATRAFPIIKGPTAKARALSQG